MATLKPSELRGRFKGLRKRRHDLGFYRQFVPRGGLCFDVGANVGNRTELFIALGARVVAIEPQPVCAESLRQRFPKIAVIEAAAGPRPGTAELRLANYHTLASLSDEWIQAVRASGRFDEFRWETAVTVQMVTLDDLIARHGEPDFCKIDVEGFELGVVQGLSRPLGAVAFEFDVERRDDRIDAAERLANLGMTRFNFSFGESLEFALPRWITVDALKTFLAGPAHTVSTFGDIYAAR